MAKTPDEIVAEIDRKQNEEDLDLPRRAVEAASKGVNAVKDKVKEDLTGGAYVGSRLNLPSNTNFGKLSPSDTRLHNETKAQNARDKMSEAYGAKEKKSKTESRYGMKKGGKVKSASARADGIAIRGKTRA